MQNEGWLFESRKLASHTKTVNPLHFEDIEPKRFEDLVRQLAYDFKPWRKLEATGRSGSDDGFDARGYEIVGEPPDDADDTSDETQRNARADRVWLVQCKREKTITPAKMVSHLSKIVLSGDLPLYGAVIAAACDFSKKTRDAFAKWCRDNGVQEWHLWGKAELEDMLFQPKNDNLLFAYFGLSLVIRRRSRTTELRRQITVKNRIKKLIEKENWRPVLVRDVDDAHYPYEPEDGTPVRWRARRIVKVTAIGVCIDYAARFAWLAPDSREWDCAFSANGQDLGRGQDRWVDETVEETALQQQASDAWQAFPEEERAWLHVHTFIPYSSVELVDEEGDDAFSGPHIYVSNWDRGYQRALTWIETVWGERRKLDLRNFTDGRIVKFAEPLRTLRPRQTGF